ncbi:YezD family protein [Sphingomonadaceae bacterium jetA1]|jgi:hypothetical protein|uniref:YezD family protein n=1 Tax=Facivitalis istanbulensis TaxID=3075838 RepID=UPI00346A5C8E
MRIDPLPVGIDAPVRPQDNAVLRAIGEALAGLDYGSVLITVHAGRVVQLDVTRKRRFPD